MMKSTKIVALGFIASAVLATSCVSKKQLE